MDERMSTCLRGEQQRQLWGELRTKASPSPRSGVSLCVNTLKHAVVFTCGCAGLPLWEYPTKKTMKPHENLIQELLGNISLLSVLL